MIYIIIGIVAALASVLVSYADVKGQERKREEARQAEAYRKKQEKRRREEERQKQQEQRRQQLQQQKQRDAERKRREYEEAERIRKAEQKRKQKEAEAARAAKEAKMSEQRRYIAQQRRLVTDRVRYDVLTRDGHRCVICGASAKDGITLHVDHIIPLSKGGTSDMSNLRTLCERCNMGKADKIEIIAPVQQVQPASDPPPKDVSLDEFASMLDAVFPKECENIDRLLEALTSHNIPYIDKRAVGGCLWIEASDNNNAALSSVLVSGSGLEYAKSTRNFGGNPGWFIK